MHVFPHCFVYEEGLATVESSDRLHIRAWRSKSALSTSSSRVWKGK